MSSYYYILDHPRVLQNAFFPRRWQTRCPEDAFDLQVSVAEDVALHCRFYMGGEDLPTILYFHGNGEIASDYDGFAPMYKAAGANLVVAEFRGYGTSGGTPTFTAMLKDAHLIFEAVRKELAQREFTPRLFIMGRSLGSVAAFELAAAYPAASKGLIIESGFVCASRIARRVGFLRDELELLEEECRQKIRSIRLPALVIHGEDDNLVPMTEAKAIFGLLEAEEKELLTIPYGEHNTLIFEGEEEYFGAISNFIKPKAVSE